MNGEVATELSQGEMDFCMRREFGELSERLFLTSLQCLMMLAALRGLDSPFRETQVYLAKTGGPLLCARPLPGPTWHPAWHIPSKICPEKKSTAALCSVPPQDRGSQRLPGHSVGENGEVREGKLWGVPSDLSYSEFGEV